MPSHHYEVRVSGPLEELEHLDDLGVERVVDTEITTSLTGRFADQEALSAFLRRLRALGLEVVEIRRVVEEGDLDRTEREDESR
ncbi:MAG TPA: hypothetical protein VHR35_05590 [Nocardioides sp.]|jgi:hypothetical protein|nr:hypothetical protein [Nocardioides sp.]HEX3295646.1 hypothetical protein [Nocardioides sp.]